MAIKHSKELNKKFKLLRVETIKKFNSWTSYGRGGLESYCNKTDIFLTDKLIYSISFFMVFNCIINYSIFFFYDALLFYDVKRMRAHFG